MFVLHVETNCKDNECDPIYSFCEGPGVQHSETIVANHSETTECFKTWMEPYPKNNDVIFALAQNLKTSEHQMQPQQWDKHEDVQGTFNTYPWSPNRITNTQTLKLEGKESPGNVWFSMHTNSFAGIRNKVTDTHCTHSEHSCSSLQCKNVQIKIYVLLQNKVWSDECYGGQQSIKSWGICRS